MPVVLYTQGQAIQFIEKVFGSGSLTNQGNNISVVCPKCQLDKGDSYEKKKLVISTDKFLLHCWVCGYKSRNLYGLLKSFHPEHVPEYLTKFVDSEQLQSFDPMMAGDSFIEKLHLPDDFLLLATANPSDSWMVRKAIDYLKSRNLGDEASLWRWKFGISEEDNLKFRVIVPSFDSEGNLNYFTGRALYPKMRPTYFNPKCERESVIFNELNIDWKKPLVITEGPFDAMKAGPNATCILGSVLTPEYRLFQKIVENQTSVYLALDPDAKQKQDSLAKLLCEMCVDVKMVQIPEQYKDVGEMESSEQFMPLLKQAITWSMDYAFQTSIKGATYR